MLKQSISMKPFFLSMAMAKFQGKLPLRTNADISVNWMLELGVCTGLVGFNRGEGPHRVLVPGPPPS
jgi:hypothetical protein